MYKLSQHWTEAEHGLVADTLRVYMQQLSAPKHPYFDFIDLAHAQAAVRSGDVPAVLIGHYLFIFGVGQLWFGKQQVLFEIVLHAVAGIPPSVPLKDLPAAVGALASDLRCVLVSVGNGTLRPALTRHWESAGFVPSNIELTKVTQYGKSILGNNQTIRPG